MSKTYLANRDNKITRKERIFLKCFDSKEYLTYFY